MPDPPDSSFTADSIAIVGVGLIGGSIAAALKQRGFRGRIVGVGRNESRLAGAKQAGLLDEFTTDCLSAAADAELIIFCTPIERIVDGVRAAAVHAQPGSLITDAGSVKQAVCDGVSDGLPKGVTFIGSHPLAGAETRGFEHADGDLFADCVCVVTPRDDTPADALARLKRFWQFLDMHVVELSPEEHDRALARTSHLPHVAAAALARSLRQEFRQFAASGFRDTTRIAAGDPNLWTGILLANAENVVAALDELEGELQQFRRVFATRDAAALKSLLEVAKTNRDALRQ